MQQTHIRPDKYIIPGVTLEAVHGPVRDFQERLLNPFYQGRQVLADVSIGGFSLYREPSSNVNLGGDLQAATQNFSHIQQLIDSGARVFRSAVYAAGDAKVEAVYFVKAGQIIGEPVYNIDHPESPAIVTRGELSDLLLSGALSYSLEHPEIIQLLRTGRMPIDLTHKEVAKVFLESIDTGLAMQHTRGRATDITHQYIRDCEELVLNTLVPVVAGLERNKQGRTFFKEFRLRIRQFSPETYNTLIAAKNDYVVKQKLPAGSTLYCVLSTIEDKITDEFVSAKALKELEKSPLPTETARPEASLARRAASFAVAGMVGLAGFGLALSHLNHGWTASAATAVPIVPPTIVYDSRAEVGDMPAYPGVHSSDYPWAPAAGDVPFYHPGFPRVPADLNNNSPIRDFCKGGNDLIYLSGGDDNNIINNHEAFDAGHKIDNYQIFGSEKFLVDGGCVPVFFKRVSYPTFEVQEYFYYRADNPGFGPLAGFHHEHDYQIALVWVNKATGQPFHFAVRDHALPFVGDIWQQKDVRSADELKAYGQWRSGELGLKMNSGPPVWRDGGGPIIGPPQIAGVVAADGLLHYRSSQMYPGRDGIILYPLESIIAPIDIDADHYYKTNEHHGIADKTSPPPVAPWLIPSMKDPDGLIKNKVFIQNHMVYARLGSPAEMSFELGGKKSDQASWDIPQSAVDGKIGYIVSSDVVEPQIKLIGTGDGVLDLQGIVLGFGGDESYLEFNLDKTPIKVDETITVTPHWSKVATNSGGALSYFVDVNGMPVAFQSKPNINGPQFEAALKAVTPNPAPSGELSVGQRLGLVSGIAGLGALGYGVYRWNQRTEAGLAQNKRELPAATPARVENLRGLTPEIENIITALQGIKNSETRGVLSADDVARMRAQQQEQLRATIETRRRELAGLFGDGRITEEEYKRAEGELEIINI